MKPETIPELATKLPPSALGPDGKLRRVSDEERRERCESARRRVAEVSAIPDDPNDPPDEEWMRGIDEMCPYRPQFKDMY